jgi:hypothetical protein
LGGDHAGTIVRSNHNYQQQQQLFTNQPINKIKLVTSERMVASSSCSEPNSVSLRPAKRRNGERTWTLDDDDDDDDDDAFFAALASFASYVFLVVGVIKKVWRNFQHCDIRVSLVASCSTCEALHCSMRWKKIF